MNDLLTFASLVLCMPSSLGEVRQIIFFYFYSPTPIYLWCVYGKGNKIMVAPLAQVLSCLESFRRATARKLKNLVQYGMILGTLSQT